MGVFSLSNPKIRIVSAVYIPDYPNSRENQAAPQNYHYEEAQTK
jgi:hypothetical protein